MKLNTLGKIRDALRSMTPQVEVPISLAAAARLSLQRMMDLTEGRAVLWPNEFVAPNW
jgi:quinolinate synthase